MKRSKPNDVPPFRKHKGTGQGYVLLDGRRHYLGPFGTPEARQRYDRLVAEWLAGGRQTRVDPNDITIVELTARFWRHVESYYAESPGERSHFHVVLGHLKRLYGRTKAADFGPRAFKTIRQAMVAAGWTRKHVNDQANRLRRVFRWAVENEIVSPTVYHGLQAVAGLRRGHTEAAESEPVTPVPEAHVDAVLEHVPPVVAALIRLQLTTAARPGELLRLRPVDLDTSGRVWLFKPQQHKNAFRGHARTIYFGPRSRAILEPFLAGCPVDGYVFSPRRAVAERAADAVTHRRADQPADRRKTDRTVGDCYTTPSYRRCITRACQEAGVDEWTPLRLRHTAGTAIRREFGLEGAQLLLGHRRADVTEIYAEVNHTKALEIARKIG